MLGGFHSEAAHFCLVGQVVIFSVLCITYQKAILLQTVCEKREFVTLVLVTIYVNPMHQMTTSAVKVTNVSIVIP